jgi:hypothetical protein
MENYVESLLPFAVESKPNCNNGEIIHQSTDRVLLKISDDSTSFCIRGVWIDGVEKAHLLTFTLPNGLLSSGISYTLEGDIEVNKSHLRVFRDVINDCVKAQLKKAEVS